MKRTKTRFTGTLIALTGMMGASVSVASPVSDWFSKDKADRGPVTELMKGEKLDTVDAVTEAKKKVWQAYKEGAIKRGWDKGIPKELGGMEKWVQDKTISPLRAKVGDKEMLYIILEKGEKPEGGWPIYVTLHGGGGNARAKGPHSWGVNTNEWYAQMSLTTNTWESPGLYIIPRMADDREGRWYYGYNQIFIDRLIQQAILFHDVNPDKVFLQGISEGGYTAFRLGSMMADRWAGSCAMAAAEPLNTSPPENLRHVAFRCGIGEKDTMFDRHILARNYFKKLAELAKAHPGEYVNFHDEQKGRGHGIEYKSGPTWVSQHTRNAVPKSVTWTVIKQHDRHRNRLYWLAIDGKQEVLPLTLNADANKETNVIEISATMTKHRKDQPTLFGVPAKGIDLRIYLSDTLVDLSKEVTINVNGNRRFKGMVTPSMEAIILSTAERGDPKQVFSAQVKLKL